GHKEHKRKHRTGRCTHRAAANLVRYWIWTPSGPAVWRPRVPTTWSRRSGRPHGCMRTFSADAPSFMGGTRQMKEILNKVGALSSAAARIQ
uniref:Uncharacterized protein n=1 Tax=Aegilops tauschii subsp. strangulata TaxID=200361 RepID=A0A453I256_AEGTS